MTRMRKRGWRELIVLLAALACAGSWAAGQVRSMRDRSEVAKMTEKMKTVCVGRYLVDVPELAEVTLTGGMLDGFNVEAREESEAEFRSRVSTREAEISERGVSADGKAQGGMVAARDLRVPGMFGRILVFGHTRSYHFEAERRIEDEWVSVEAHAHREGMSFSLSAKYAEETRADLAEKLLAQLQLRGEEEVPVVPGFCIRRAVFVEPLPVHKNEHMVMYLGLPDHPDLSLAMFSIAGGNPGPGILARTANVDASTSAEELLRITKLRASKRSINGIDGEEVLERVREYNFATTYGFNWESRGVKEDPLQPYLSLELQSGISARPGGKPVETSLHEDALLSLWDSIASSIRLRKSGPPPSGPAPEPSGPKLGAVATAGELCPQSGWWRCSEGGPGVDVHGGQLQYIRKGERMPQALLLPRQTLWQKLKRIQPSIETSHRTAWTLVDKRMRPRSTPAVALAPAVIPAEGADIANVDRAATPLGSFARTGELCPASGWWRCEEPHALDGTRWFPAGSVLPTASFQVPAGVFGKSSGPEVIHRRSTWQLLRHASASGPARVASAPPEGLSLGEPPALV